MALKIEIDAVRKYRNNHEFRMVPRAQATLGAETYSVVSDGHLEGQICRTLLRDADYLGEVEFWRGPVPVWRPKSCIWWAASEMGNGGQNWGPTLRMHRHS